MQGTCDRAFVIAIDGMRGPAVHEADTPNLHSFMAHSAWTVHARTVMPSSSYQAWGSLFHSVGPEKHNCGGSTPIGDDVAWPSFMKVAGQQHPDWVMGAFSCWKPINDDIIEVSAGARMVSGPDIRMTIQGSRFIREERPQMFFIHLDNLDAVGHLAGYESEEYLVYLTIQDMYVGKLMEAIDSIDDGRSLVIVVSDHGGYTFEHEGSIRHSHGADNDACMEIFWGCRAPSVAPGTELSCAVNIMDTAPVIAACLGLTPPPAWEGRVPPELA
jgi:hypothetical protein